MFRHPPGNNQRVVALFLALGHHDALISRLHRAYHSRWKTMGDTLKQLMPGWANSPSFGGTSYWVQGPATLDANDLARRAMDDGIIIEPGQVFFDNPEGNANTFRLGFSSIPEERIAPGLERLANIVRTME